jgi:uracil-DNA glycosylase family 4
MADSLRKICKDVVACRACSRLVAHREKVAREKRRAYREQTYWGRPVPTFGSARSRLVIVGLAPGAHGSNRTGRMFTGDSSGDTLYPALHQFGFASQPNATARNDGMRLVDCCITAAVRCAPPGNKPTRQEFATCRPFLLRELRVLTRARIYLALGRLAFDTLVRALPEIEADIAERYPHFAHGAEIPLSRPGRILLCSYHPSRQNTQTGRLTPEMFLSIFRRSRQLLEPLP